MTLVSLLVYNFLARSLGESKDHMGKTERRLYFLLSEVKDLTSQSPPSFSPFTLFVRTLLYFLVEMLGVDSPAMEDK